MIFIPKPKRLHWQQGVFIIKNRSKVVIDTSFDYSIFLAAKSIAQQIEEMCGFSMMIYKNINMQGEIIISYKNEENPEAYTLQISEDNIQITGAKSGVFYALQTLRQMIKQSGAALPCCHIEDEPCYPVRGVYQDITRGKIPTLDALKLEIDKLAQYKINQFQFYVENIFPFDFASEMWAGRGHITPGEVIELDEYCKQHYIELVPSMATFGHLYDLLTTKKHSHLREMKENNAGKAYWFAKGYHHTLDITNPESIALVKRMIDIYLPLFSSSKFNICGDETFDLGKGRSKEYCENHGKDKAYVIFLNQIIEHVAAKGKQVMFWGDMVLRSPQLLANIPKNVIALNWDYDPNVSSIAHEQISKSGLEQYVCSGTWSWSTFINRYSKAYKNTLKHALYGKAFGASGLLQTDWGDIGHLSPIEASLPVMIYAAALGWNTNVYASEDEVDVFEKDLSILEYGDFSGELLKIIHLAAEASQMDWGTLNRIYNAKMGYMPEDLHQVLNIDGIYKSLKSTQYFSASSITQAYKDISDGYEKVLRLAPTLNPSFGDGIKPILVALKGLALSNAILAILYRYDGEQEIALPLSPDALADELELWYDDFAKKRRILNQESELYLVREAIFGWSSILRTYQ